MSDYDYDRDNVEATVADLAELRLEGSHTVSITAWQDGDFEVAAFRTIDATYPDMPEAVDVDGLPFHHEQIAFSTVGDEAGWLRHEVVRRYTGETGSEPTHSERISGYTPNWPAPIEDDDGDDDGPTYPGPTFPGRFADD